MSDQERSEVHPEGNGPEAPEDGGGGEAHADPLEAARQEAARYKDQLLRTAADFDNFRKRARREQSDAEKRGRDDLFRDILPVFDNLERAAAHAETATDVQSLLEGIRMVMRQFHDTLGRIGIERVPGVGTPFDPNVHEAIQHLETHDHPPGTVAAEIAGGYRAADRLLRPAMVVVAKSPTASTDSQSSAGGQGDGTSGSS